MRPRLSRSIFIKENRKKHNQILLCEPGLVNRKIVYHALTRFGYSVKIADNREDALELFETGLFIMILMGTCVGGQKYDELIHRIRDIEKKRGFEKTTLLMMTECSVDTDTAPGSVDEVIAKPVVVDHLLSVIEKWTRKQQRPLALDQRGPDTTGIFNYGAALERATGDKDFLEMVVNEFIRVLPEKILAIKTNFKEKDMEGVMQKAHSLRGSASTIGADAISTAALELEKAGDVGDTDLFYKKIQGLDDEFQKFVTHINTMNWREV